MIPTRKAILPPTRQQAVVIPPLPDRSSLVAPVGGICDYSYNIPPGMIAWKIGEQMNMEGRKWICDRVSASDARFRSGEKLIHVSNCHDR